MLLYGYAFVCECMWKDAKDNHGKDLETKDPRTRTELVNVFSGTSGGPWFDGYPLDPPPLALA